MLGPLLQYHSLKAVFLHTDANTRFQISRHMLSIHNVERITPLKVDHLDIEDFTVKVKELRIVRLNGNVLRPVKVDQQLSSFDFDELGFRFTSDNNVLLPEDVAFEEEDEIETRFDTEVDEEFYMDYLRVYEQALKLLFELKLKEGKTVKDYLKGLEPLPNDVLL